MLHIISRTKNVLSNEVGSSNVEVVIWIAVVLLVGAVLYSSFRNIGYRQDAQTYYFDSGVSTNYSWN